jgi:hypothetical protein
MKAKTYYRPILECCEEAAVSGASSDQIRACTEKKIGKSLTAGELGELLKPTPGAKGNFFAWALAHLVQYKFLSKYRLTEAGKRVAGPPQYQLTEAGKGLAEYLRKNPSVQMDKGFLQHF